MFDNVNVLVMHTFFLIDICTFVSFYCSSYDLLDHATGIFEVFLMWQLIDGNLYISLSFSCWCYASFARLSY